MNNQVASLAKAIVQSFDLCGNPRNAARQWFDDESLPFDSSLYDKAYMLAVSIWDKYRREAGVKSKYIGRVPTHN